MCRASYDWGTTMQTLSGQDVKNILATLALLMEQKKDELGQLDQAMGDGDLGLTMSKGFRAVADAVAGMQETDVGQLLGKAGMVMASTAPSTMGTLVGTGFMRGAKAVMGKQEVSLADVAAIMGAFVEGIVARGKAKPGDKTILDSLHPAAEAVKEAARSGQTLAEGLAAGYRAAQEGLEATKRMVAQHGKAACFQEQTLGKPDPGATVGMLLMKVLAEYTSQR
ncbi:dihydroxyacetone kinase subunit DhaL [Carboxydochorda subterranea]|uniref:Dihydroxyacetone kinase subunit DhaL n=1 Tax=Carboxydichorda subterranea TaxID=3109565 RepID=A0ABZ1BYZ3_9FIRM|nr:dihydroxyacetone kinase subunit DhaL [Limnochorda sp. L945t]WRP17287.1 dihydroxyacetone kinase subunit DhaL [Limnochorda sp. L945t]